MNYPPIYVIIEQGLVTGIKNIPPGVEIHVLDSDVDVEGNDAEELAISPVDGELCSITRFESPSNEAPSH